MNEIELIQRHIAGAGYRVQDVKYHTEQIALTVEASPYWIGSNLAVPQGHAYFYGNVSMWAEIYSLANLALKNAIRTVFDTSLFGGAAYIDTDIIFGVNLYMGLQGNGDYSGIRRIYNLGFNRVDIDLLDLDPVATFMVMLYINGLLFTLI